MLGQVRPLLGFAFAFRAAGSELDRTIRCDTYERTLNMNVPTVARTEPGVDEYRQAVRGSVTGEIHRHHPHCGW